MVELTPAQRQVLEEFTRRAEAGQSPPTLRELCGKFGWSSPHAARTHVLALVKKGKLAQEARHQPRGAALPAPLMRRVPLVAGTGGVAMVMKVESEIVLPTYLAPDDESFAMQVSDSDMEGAHVVEDDIVVVRAAKKAILNDLAAVEIGGRLVVRKIDADDRAELVAVTRPSRGAATSVPLKHLRIRGVVRSLVRRVSDR